MQKMTTPVHQPNTVVRIALTACLMATGIGARVSGSEPEALAKPGRQPNIIVFLADDMGYADAGYMGGKDIQTPNLDKLARGGAILTSLYVQPVCSPTRACLMTGRYVSHTGVYDVVRPNAPWGLPLKERTLAHALGEAGYQTSICGKWHLGEFQPAYQPTRRGFGHQYGPWFGSIDYFTHQRDGQHDWHRNDQPCHAKGYATHLLAAEACRWIAQSQAEKPLFLYLPFNAVHAPLQVPPKYLQPYAKLPSKRRAYAGMVAAMDEAVGQVFDALGKKGILDNTLILFSSDNGGADPGRTTDNGPLPAGKGTLYEGGIRTCGFATWPDRIKAGITISEPLHTVDWYPTLVRLAGGTPEQKLPLDGQDIWPVLTQGARSTRESLLLCGRSPEQRAIRMGNWKLIVDASDKGAREARNTTAANGKIALYDLASDLGEKNNVAAQNPDVVKRLHAKLNELMKTSVPPASGVAPDVNTRKKAGRS